MIYHLPPYNKALDTELEISLRTLVFELEISFWFERSISERHMFVSVGSGLFPAVLNLQPASFKIVKSRL